MIGTLLTAGAGALAFKLGMDAQRMSSEGKSAWDIAASMPRNAVTTVVGVYNACHDTLSRAFGGDKPKGPEEQKSS